MPQDNTRNCQCTTPQYTPFVFDCTAYQNSANAVYEAKNAIVVDSQAGIFTNKSKGAPLFKSDYERMQYLMGKENRGGCAGTSRRVIGLGSN
jgi:hypothetical protein